MTGETNHNEKRSYNAEDLRRYLAGEMPAAEMHALELASLDDPLLDDALEGMRNIKPDTREDLDGLKRRLAEKTAQKKRLIPIWRSPAKIAAAAVLLIGLSGLGYYFTIGTSGSKNIALKDDKAKSFHAAAETAAPVTANVDSPAVANPSPAETSKTGAATVLPGKQDPTAGNTAMAPARAKTAKKGQPLNPEREEAAPGDGGAEKSEREALVNNEETKKEEWKNDDRIKAASAAAPKLRKVSNADSGTGDVAPPEATAKMAKDKTASSSIPEMIQGRAAGVAATPATAPGAGASGFSGRVLDDKGQPVAGASVTMGKIVTRTDIEGKFILPAIDGNNNHLDFSSVGYQPLTLIPDFQHPADMTVTLAPATVALNDVVVTRYGSKRKAPDPAPTPASGWKKYRNYLGANKLAPTIDSSLHGTEKVTFSLTKNGEPVDFVVDQSLSSEHDSVAVRIIRNGPKWKPSRDTTRRMSLALPY